VYNVRAQKDDRGPIPFRFSVQEIWVTKEKNCYPGIISDLFPDSVNKTLGLTHFETWRFLCPLLSNNEREPHDHDIFSRNISKIQMDPISTIMNMKYK
jgi:hypothetical protein